MTLIAALGAPMSGKTTGMMGLAYQLKMQGQACEFVPEPARLVIDRLGYADQEQIEHMEQETIDRAKAHPDRIWLSDSGIYHGQFYGGKPYGAEDYDMVIFFDQVHKAGRDTGRLHDHRQAMALQERMAQWSENQANVVRYSHMLRPDYAAPKLRA